MARTSSRAIYVALRAWTRSTHINSVTRTTYLREPRYYTYLRDPRAKLISEIRAITA